MAARRVIGIAAPSSDFGDSLTARLLVALYAIFLCLGQLKVPGLGSSLEWSTLFGLGAAGYLVFFSRNPFRWNAVAAYMLLMCAVIAISSLMSPRSDQAAWGRFANTFVQLTLLGWVLISGLRTRENRYALLWGMVAGGVILSIGPRLGVLHSVRAVNPLNGDVRYTIQNYDPNHLAAMLSMALLCSIFIALCRDLPTRQRILAVAMSLAIFPGVIQTASRGGFLALAVGLLTLGLFADLGSRWMKAGVIAALLLGGIVGMLANPTLRARFERTLESGDTTNRNVLTREALRLFSEKPLLGHGLQVSQQFTQRAQVAGVRLQAEVYSTHNTATYFLITGGIIALLTWIGLHLTCIACVATSGLQERGIALAGLLLIATFALTVEFQVFKVYWLWFALCASVSPLASPRSVPSTELSPVGANVV